MVSPPLPMMAAAKRPQSKVTEPSAAGGAAAVAARVSGAGAGVDAASGAGAPALAALGAFAFFFGDGGASFFGAFFSFAGFFSLCGFDAFAFLPEALGGSPPPE